MGNCQAADAAEAVVIQHPDGRMERAHWPLSANNVMAANPGHYVAVIITVTHPRSSSSDHRGSVGGGGGKPVRYLNLLRQEDTLLVGQLYRLVSFEDVLREFGSKRRVRLSKLLSRKKEEIRRQCDGANSSPSTVTGEEEVQEGMMDSLGSESESCSVRMERNGQWRPTLQTIAEAGSFK